MLRCSASTPDESRGYSKERTKSRRSDEGSRRAPPLTSRGSSNSKRRSRNRGRSRSTTNSGTISAGYATVAVSIIAAAGSAMLVAAAIYFVRWSKVFVWVRSTLGSSLLALINAAWVRLVSFVGQLVGVTDEG